MNKPHVVRSIIVVCFLVLYEIAARLEWLDSFTFIPFSTMIVSMVKHLSDPAYLVNHFGITTIEIIMSFLGAVIFGIIFGIILWRSRFAYHVFQPYLMLFYATPFFALYPIFISVLGIGSLPVIMIGMLFALPAVVSNTAIGFLEINKVLEKVGYSFKLPFWKMVIHIYFPAAWPFIFTGLKLAASYSIVAVIATEFILSARGLGYSISYSYDNFDINGMYGSILLVIMIALTVNTVLGYVESRLYRRNS